MQRKIESKIEKEVSTAVYKGFKFKFITNRFQGRVSSILVDGVNTRSVGAVVGAYDVSGELSIKFKGMAPDHDISQKIFEELESIRMDNQRAG
ncbi:hypothetical protein AAW12_15900 [Sphingobacterium sp. Ag1]|uniref:hypothetical protein n=1 Tax=Sphingobacterium sp. Ag1 TaxID=1643451 RepID=UPI000627D662|nr:hypothetical protein [Sphingobacterium sp. Ag1]KKO90561.1 hypothetical protein AAW12_15900 [Sphingobacterium sp. Ag1]